MAKRLMAQCEHCKDWFPSQQLTGPEREIVQALKNNRFLSVEKCAHCEKMSTISNTNLRVM